MPSKFSFFLLIKVNRRKTSRPADLGTQSSAQVALRSTCPADRRRVRPGQFSAVHATQTRRHAERSSVRVQADGYPACTQTADLQGADTQVTDTQTADRMGGERRRRTASGIRS